MYNVQPPAKLPNLKDIGILRVNDFRAHICALNNLFNLGFLRAMHAYGTLSFGLSTGGIGLSFSMGV